jgi:gamma-glutamylcyclotransferase (GGCT)/AIG2-like uncharacterized protein YtfP
MNGVTHLFVYGTLLPGEARWVHLEPYVAGGGAVDTAPGELFDTGLGYPAARFAGTGTGTIHGRTFALLEASVGEALDRLDVIEGAVGGRYLRTSLTTGRGVLAWSYEYGGGLTLTKIASGSWTLHRRA